MMGIKIRKGVYLILAILLLISEASVGDSSYLSTAASTSSLSQDEEYTAGDDSGDSELIMAGPNETLLIHFPAPSLVEGESAANESSGESYDESGSGSGHLSSFRGRSSRWNISKEQELAQEHPLSDPLSIAIPMTVIYSLILLSGLVGNVSTCVVIARTSYMHTATNYYLFR
jgi:hypothetical protein